MFGLRVQRPVDKSNLILFCTCDVEVTQADKSVLKVLSAAAGWSLIKVTVPGKKDQEEARKEVNLLCGWGLKDHMPDRARSQSA